MLGQFEIANASIMTDENGDINAIFKVSQNSRYAARTTIKPLKELFNQDKKLIVKVDEKRNKRTLDQNALLWALLTIYADEQNGGRTGGVQPEDIYYRMLEQYGVATFLLTIPGAEDELKKVFRVVTKVDEREYNGVTLYMFKCYYGSSKYDTKQMANLIDGVFDELSKLGVSDKNYMTVQGYREEWQGV